MQGKTDIRVVGMMREKYNLRVFHVLQQFFYSFLFNALIAMLGDDTHVSAISVVGPVFSLANAVATMLGAGGCAVIANFLGAENHEDAKTVCSLCVWAAILFGAVFTSSMLIATESILHFLGATEDMLGFAGTYLRVLAIGSPLMLFRDRKSVV